MGHINKGILRQLKENDPEFDDLVVCREEEYRGSNEFWAQNAHDLELLGYYIGKNTNLMELCLHSEIFHGFYNAIEPFFRGLNRNRSIQKISFHHMCIMGGEVFQSMRPFFTDNNNLSGLEVVDCVFAEGCARCLSSALRICSKSLKYIKLSANQMGDERLEDIVEALAVHPHLEEIKLRRMSVGRNECVALSTLLFSAVTTLRTLDLRDNIIDDEGVDILVGVLINSTQLQYLNLSDNDIGDEGVDTLVGALTNNRSFQRLNLSSNCITARGCQSLATLLENPNSNLEVFQLNGCNVGDEGARIFASALTTNRKLSTLDVSDNGITAEGYSSFSKVLCYTASVNRTFLSNHTLESLCWSRFMTQPANASNIPADVRSLLALNNISRNNKKKVAIKKILKHHQHFDMLPFFEWELKVLPIAIKWFERAKSIEDAAYHVVKINNHKLGTIYQFIRAMPEVFEPTPAAGEKRKRSAFDGKIL